MYAHTHYNACDMSSRLLKNESLLPPDFDLIVKKVNKFSKKLCFSKKSGYFFNNRIDTVQVRVYNVVQY